MSDTRYLVSDKKGKNMTQFFISLLFFTIALAFFWFVLNWIGYKKDKTACACGTNSCSAETDNAIGENIDIQQINFDNITISHVHDEDCHSCNLIGAEDCTCDD